MTDERVICPMCGIINDDIIAQMYHKFTHFDWYACEQRVKMLQGLSIKELEARQFSIDKWKKENKKKK